MQKKIVEAEEEAKKAKIESESLKNQLKVEKDSSKVQTLKSRSFDLKCLRCELDLGLILKESAKYPGYFCFSNKNESKNV